MSCATGNVSVTGTLDIYLVDDAANVRERLVALIRTVAGASVAGAASRADVAIREILALSPDLVILDIALAQGNGFEVLRELHARAPQIEVYMLSNSASEPYRRRAADLGAIDLFDKSLEFEAVRDVLRQRTLADTAQLEAMRSRAARPSLPGRQHQGGQAPHSSSK